MRTGGRELLALGAVLAGRVVEMVADEGVGVGVGVVAGIGLTLGEAAAVVGPMGGGGNIDQFQALVVIIATMDTRTPTITPPIAMVVGVDPSPVIAMSTTVHPTVIAITEGPDLIVPAIIHLLVQLTIAAPLLVHPIVIAGVLLSTITPPPNAMVLLAMSKAR